MKKFFENIAGVPALKEEIKKLKEEKDSIEHLLKKNRGYSEDLEARLDEENSLYLKKQKELIEQNSILFDKNSSLRENLIKTNFEFDFLTNCFANWNQKSIPGNEHNPIIQEWTKRFTKINTDDVAWCSIFLLEMVRLTAENISINFGGKVIVFRNEYSKVTPLAKSWKNVLMPEYTAGSIQLVVLNRTDNPMYGHVGIPIKTTDTHIYILGGNQSSAVNITAFRKNLIDDIGYAQIIDWKKTLNN